MSVMLTEKAASEVKKIIAYQKLDTATVLRVGVAGGGCSGFQYSLGFDTQFDPKADTKTDQHGVAVVVDKKSDLFLDGTTLDFISQFDGYFLFVMLVVGLHRLVESEVAK